MPTDQPSNQDLALQQLMGRVVIAAAEIEDRLAELGAVGNGSFERVKSIQDRLPLELIAKVRKVAGFRNSVAHKGGLKVLASTLPSRLTRFFSEASAANSELSTLIAASVPGSAAQSATAASVGRSPEADDLLVGQSLTEYLASDDASPREREDYRRRLAGEPSVFDEAMALRAQPPKRVMTTPSPSQSRSAQEICRR